MTRRRTPLCFLAALALLDAGRAGGRRPRRPAGEGGQGGRRSGRPVRGADRDAGRHRPHAGARRRHDPPRPRADQRTHRQPRRLHPLQHFNFANTPTTIDVYGPRQEAAYPAKLIATDQTRMLTLLKIEETGLPTPQPTPKAEMKIGQTTLALGRTLPDAIDTLRRSPPASSAPTGRIWGKAVQTDARISPANYGGPLIDLQGPRPRRRRAGLALLQGADGRLRDVQLRPRLRRPARRRQRHPAAPQGGDRPQARRLRRQHPDARTPTRRGRSSRPWSRVRRPTRPASSPATASPRSTASRSRRRCSCRCTSAASTRATSSRSRSTATARRSS